MKRFRFPFPLAVLAGALLVAAGLGTRAGLWHFSVGFQLLRWAGYLGLAAAVTALVGFSIPKARAGQGRWLGAALVLGLGVAAVPAYWLGQVRGVPPIHDITTDPENPPAFVAVVPLRANAPNPVAYGGAAVAEAQRRAYPDIQPVTLAIPPAEAFAKALDAAKRMGWEVVAQDAAAGRIEATATTLWFGFKDDIVVRVTPAASGSRVDMRSVSRVGRSDVGTNAKRIRAYVAKLLG